MSRQLHHAATCQCGALFAECFGDPEFVSACHCKACQRKTGSALSVGVFYQAVHVRVSGANKTWMRVADTGRSITNHFCPKCGTTVLWKTEKRPDLVVLSLGCFAEKFCRPKRAFWVEQKPAWLGLAQEVEHINGQS